MPSGKDAGPPTMQTLPSESALPKKPKTIKKALEKPHPAPERWQETYDAIKEMHLQFPTPVDTMGCNMAKWNEIDPWVHNMYH